jgi:hypothetical protein
MKPSTTPQIVKQYLAEGLLGSMSYAAYRTLVHALLEQGKVTGPEQSEALVEYTKLNEARMHRWEKRYTPNAALLTAVSSLPSQTWLAITEGWCGDAAQTLPVFERLSAANPAIRFKLILRDEHPAIMDHYLTGKGRSVPKVIALDDSGNTLWIWGPRPQEAQTVIDKGNLEGWTLEEKKEKLHSWYAKNQQAALEQELLGLMA